MYRKDLVARASLCLLNKVRIRISLDGPQLTPFCRTTQTQPLQGSTRQADLHS